MKRKPADAAFSNCVREASDWVCLKCQKQYERGSQGLHNSHIFSRRHRTIRWDAMNTKALCFSCHQWFGGNPVESGNWITNLFGQEHMDILIEKKEARTKISKLEEKTIAKHYRDELKQILNARANGETGAIAFVSYQ